MLDNVGFVKGNRTAFAIFIAACVAVLYDKHVQLDDEVSEWKTPANIS